MIFIVFPPKLTGHIVGVVPIIFLLFFHPLVDCSADLSFLYWKDKIELLDLSNHTNLLVFLIREKTDKRTLTGYIL